MMGVFATGFCLLLLVVPGLIVGSRLLAAPIVVSQTDRSAVDSLAASWRWTAAVRWGAFLAFLMSIVITLLGYAASATLGRTSIAGVAAVTVTFVLGSLLPLAFLYGRLGQLDEHADDSSPS